MGPKGREVELEVRVGVMFRGYRQGWGGVGVGLELQQGDRVVAPRGQGRQRTGSSLTRINIVYCYCRLVQPRSVSADWHTAVPYRTVPYRSGMALDV